QMWVRVDAPVILDRGARHAHGAQHRDPVVLRLGDGDVLDRPYEDVAVAPATVRVGEPLVASQSLEAHHVAEGRPVARRVRAHGKPAVGRTDRLIGRGVLVGRAKRPRYLAGGEVLPGLPDRERDAGLEEAHIDVLPATGLLTRAQCGGRREGAVEGAHEIADRNADLYRIAVRLSGDAHEPRIRLGHDVEPGQLRERTVLTPSGRRDVDEARVERVQHVVIVEREVAHGPRPEVLDDDVGGPHELLEDLLAIRGLEVDDERSLVPIESHEGRALAVDERLDRSDLIATFGWLDLDDLGAEGRELQ